MRHLSLPTIRHVLIAAGAFVAVTAALFAADRHIVFIDALLAYYALAVVAALALGRRTAVLVVAAAPAGFVLLAQYSNVPVALTETGTYARAIAILAFSAALLYAMPRWLTQADAFRELSEKLRERTVALETLTRSAPVAIVTLDNEGRITSWNPAAERMLGWQEQEVTGESILDLAPLHRLEVAAMLATVLQAGESVYQVAVHRQHKDGRRISLSMSASPLRDAGGEITGLVAVAEDMTSRHAAAAAVRDSEERYRMLVEEAADAIIHTDSDGNFLDVNKRACELFGYTRGEFLSLPPRSLTPPEHRQLYDAGLDDVRAGRTIRSELALIRKDGTPVWVEISAKMLADGRIQSVLRDETEKRAAALALRRGDEFRASVLESTNDAIFAMGLDRRFTLVNKRACEITGYPEEELIGQSPTLLYSPETAERSREQFEQAVQRAEPIPAYEVEIIRKDSARRILRVSLTPLMDGGEVTGIVGTAEDVTERKQLEEQFLQAQKMESIGRLAGGVAHDFNNLMTAIIGYADLAVAALPEDDPLAADLREIRETADRAANLSQQLLAFSRRQMVEPRVVNLNELIVSTHRMLRRLIGEDIELVTTTSSDLGLVRIDPNQFTQVLVNLAVNARDAMPAGGTLMLRTENVELDERSAVGVPGSAPGNYVMLMVSDTGTGMTQEVQSHLFEPFFTTKETGKGTGLGLATCYGIVKQAGGNITVTTAPGKGAAFHIYLPVAEAPSHRAADGAVSTLPPGTETILLVEDERPVRNLAVRVLRELGYAVLPAQDGEEALRIAHDTDERIDLLLTDVVMPGLGGKELARLIQKRRPSVRVLMTSGYTADEFVRRNVTEHAIPFLPKPFSPFALAAKVREVLDHATVPAI